eukprot:5353045-Prymnesium_polylepis.1
MRASATLSAHSFDTSRPSSVWRRSSAESDWVLSLRTAARDRGHVPWTEASPDVVRRVENEGGVVLATFPTKADGTEQSADELKLIYDLIDEQQTELDRAEDRRQSAIESIWGERSADPRTSPRDTLSSRRESLAAALRERRDTAALSAAERGGGGGGGGGRRDTMASAALSAAERGGVMRETLASSTISAPDRGGAMRDTMASAALSAAEHGGVMRDTTLSSTARRDTTASSICGPRGSVAERRDTASVAPLQERRDTLAAVLEERRSLQEERRSLHEQFSAQKTPPHAAPHSMAPQSPDVAPPPPPPPPPPQPQSLPSLDSILAAADELPARDSARRHTTFADDVPACRTAAMRHSSVASSTPHEGSARHSSFVSAPPDELPSHDAARRQSLAPSEQPRSSLDLVPQSLDRRSAHDTAEARAAQRAAARAVEVRRTAEEEAWRLERAAEELVEARHAQRCAATLGASDARSAHGARVARVACV